MEVIDQLACIVRTVHNRYAHSRKMMARVKNTPRKDITIGQLAKFPLICVDCGQRFGHRQSLSHHKKKQHMSARSAQSSAAVSATSALSAATSTQAAAVSEGAVNHLPSVEEESLPGLLSPISSIGELATSPTWSLSELMELQPAMVQAVTTQHVEQPQPQPGPSGLLAPRKDIRATTELNRRAEAWPVLPTVATADLYEVVRAMPDATPAELADVIVRRYELDRKKRAVLMRRLSAIIFTRDTMKREISELLPVAELDGNSAIAVVRRVAAWLQGGDVPAAHPFQ